MKKYGHSKTYGAYFKGKKAGPKKGYSWLKSFQSKHGIKAK